MSLTFIVEMLSPELIIGMDKIITDYYEWSKPKGLNDGIPPYNFDWEVYHKSEQAGLLFVSTVRTNKELVGFALYMIIKAPHHDEVVMAECDSIFVAVSHQGLGIGRKLLEHTTAELRKLGVKWMVNRHRTRTNAVPLFESLGFVPWETVYMKELN